MLDYWVGMLDEVKSDFVLLEKIIGFLLHIFDLLA